MPASYPAQICSVPVYLMTSSVRIKTINLNVKLHQLQLVEVLDFCLTVSSGKIEKPLLDEFQQDQYTIVGLLVQMHYGSDLLLDVPK